MFMSFVTIMKYILLFLVFISGYYIQAQRYTPINYLGIGVEATSYRLDIDDLTVDSNLGYKFVLETRGQIRDDFDFIYSLGVYNHNFSTRELLTNQEIEFSQLGAELNFLFAWKIAQSNHFSIELGPSLLFNGDYKLKDESAFENSQIGSLSNTITVSEFQKNNPFNVNGVIGFSTGVTHFRLMAHYHYGFLNNLSGQDNLGNDLEGKASFYTFGLRFYF